MDRRYNVARSCLRCHERKVRCDKGSPCNKCSRLNVPCEYPGPKRVKRRAPKTPSTDLVARLEQLERSITSIAGQSAQPTSRQTSYSLDQSDTGRASSESSAVVSSRQTQVQPSHGFLVKNGDYVDEPFLSRVLEKEHELQSAMGSPNTSSNAARKPPQMKVDGIITNPQLISLDIKALLPSRWQATVLWETFLSRVDPVLKVIHVPTTKPRIFAAINRPDSVPFDVHCLLFAVFFGAATAMCSDKPENDGIRADLRQYQQGIELAMYQSSFLDSPTVTSLQALTIYLTCLRYSNSGRSGFTLRGLAIRAAQSLGLHRDGKNFKLSPLECEIRRRLWWILSTTDCRMAEDHGITLTENEYGGDAQLPANIDDQNLTEKTPEMIPSQPRWTEMSFILIICEVNKMWLPMARATTNSQDGTRPEQLIAQFRNLLQEKYIQHGDPDIPIQRMGIMLSQVLISKAEVHLRQKVLQTASPDPEATQELLGMASKALHLGLQMYQDELLRGFRWLTSTYTQFHLLTYILWHLCVFPTGPFVEEAWRGVNVQFEIAERDPSWPDPGPKWPMLVQLRAKAMRIRNANASITSKQQHQPQAVDNFPLVDDAALRGIEAPLLDLDNLDFNWSEFPDWDYLAQSFDIMNQDVEI
ncbi:Transcription factorfungi [Penicillium lividum]|nr:Transcription factorfungi [Penicillium lividum]